MIYTKKYLFIVLLVGVFWEKLIDIKIKVVLDYYIKELVEVS
tara:strand:+ start:925 stop:1050 length:126 start_codon:yes stop_codon:yes gene_type:complete